MTNPVQALIRQFEASLQTLKNVITDCPSDYWDERGRDYPFCQVAFHTLFYIEYYLFDTVEEMQNQEFHKANAGSFSDYEELEGRKLQNLYSKEFILNYLNHCRVQIIKLDTDGTSGKLGKSIKINGGDMTVLEMLIYVIRHIQHHAAQLGLRVQFKTGKEMDWAGSGWTE